MSFKVYFANDVDDAALDEIAQHVPAFKGSAYEINPDGTLTIRHSGGRAVHFASRAWLAVVDE